MASFVCTGKIMNSDKTTAPLAEIFLRVKGEIRVLEYAIKSSENNQVLESRAELKKLMLRLNDSLAHNKKQSVIDYLLQDASYTALKLAEAMLYNASHHLSNCLESLSDWSPRSEFTWGDGYDQPRR